MAHTPWLHYYGWLAFLLSGNVIGHTGYSHTVCSGRLESSHCTYALYALVDLTVQIRDEDRDGGAE